MNCDFSTSFLVCDIPRDTIEVKIKIKTRWGKLTLTDDKKRRMEKFRPWGKWICKLKISTTRKVVSQTPKKTHDSGFSSDSEMWIQVRESFGHVPKYFPGPTLTISDKANGPLNDTQTVMMINNLNLLDKARNQEDVALPE